MRLFELRNFQDIILYLVPALMFIVLFGLFLGYRHFRGPDAEARKSEIIERFPGGIEGRNSPIPVGIALVIAGTVIWAFFYILYYGLLEVRI
jgi:hypothetical protein